MGKSRPKSPYYLTEAEIPPSGDPFWTRLAEKALPLMYDKRYSVEDMMAAFPLFSYSVASNLLYWIENNGLSTIEVEGKKAYWRAKPPTVHTLPSTSCPVCGGSWKDSMAGVICVMCGRLQAYYPW
jgi:hypothetical protein